MCAYFGPGCLLACFDFIAPMVEMYCCTPRYAISFIFYGERHSNRVSCCYCCATYILRISYSEYNLNQLLYIQQHINSVYELNATNFHAMTDTFCPPLRAIVRVHTFNHIKFWNSKSYSFSRRKTHILKWTNISHIQFVRTNE